MVNNKRGSHTATFRDSIFPGEKNRKPGCMLLKSPSEKFTSEETNLRRDRWSSLVRLHFSSGQRKIPRWQYRCHFSSTALKKRTEIQCPQGQHEHPPSSTTALKSTSFCLCPVVHRRWWQRLLWLLPLLLEIPWEIYSIYSLFYHGLLIIRDGLLEKWWGWDGVGCGIFSLLVNRPFPNYLRPLFQSESRCSPFICKSIFIHMKMSFICVWLKIDLLWKRGLR